MIFFKTKVHESSLAGSGLFAAEFIKQGSIVATDIDTHDLIGRWSYDRRQSQGETKIIQTGYRFVGDYFLCAPDTATLLRNEDYLNHSESPSLLYHCGVFFALSDIQPGEELTVHYKYLLSENDATSFIDSRTGCLVRGLPPDAALRASTLELAMLLNKRPAPPPRPDDAIVLPPDSGRSRAVEDMAGHRA